MIASSNNESYEEIKFWDSLNGNPLPHSLFPDQDPTHLSRRVSEIAFVPDYPNFLVSAVSYAI
jgi:hypothetical protein